MDIIVRPDPGQRHHRQRDVRPAQRPQAVGGGHHQVAEGAGGGDPHPPHPHLDCDHSPSQ